jgi:tRNA A37 threonylcarbamoyladenosine synthetase subunit TsaC/SUA5/YrdC
MLLLPTDTCYGLAGEFTEQDYLEIYRRKGRDFDKLLAILVEDFDDMRRYIEISDEQIEFLRDYPHPWSFLGKKKSDFALPAWMIVRSIRCSLYESRVYASRLLKN